MWRWASLYLRLRLTIFLAIGLAFQPQACSFCAALQRVVSQLQVDSLSLWMLLVLARRR